MSSAKGYIPSSPSNGDGDSASREGAQEEAFPSSSGTGGRLPSTPPEDEPGDEHSDAGVSSGARLPSGESPPSNETEAATRRARIRRATARGGLPDELPEGFGDPDDGDWQVAGSSEDPFEQLYLDARQHEAITSDMVRRHYELISDFWKKKERTLDSGVEQQARQIRRKYGGEYAAAERVREHLRQTKRAYDLLSDADGRNRIARELTRDRRRQALSAVMPALRGALQDGLLEPSKADDLLQRGRDAGLSEDEAASMIRKELKERGFGPVGHPEGDTFADHLRSVRWMTEEKHEQLARAAQAAPVQKAPERTEQRARRPDRASESHSGDQPSTPQWVWVAGGLAALVLLVGGVMALGGDASSSSASSARQQQQQPEPPRDGRDAVSEPSQDERDTAEERSRRRLTAEKRRFRREMTAQLSTFGRQIARIERQAGRAQAETREDLEARIDEMREDRDALEGELEELLDRSAVQLPSFKADLFERESSLRRRIERAQEDASEAVAEARASDENVRESSPSSESTSDEKVEPQRSEIEATDISNSDGTADESRRAVDDAPIQRSFGSGMSATGEMDGNRFKVTVLGGTATRTSGGGTKLVLRVRQTSENFNGKWVRWGHILKESYLMAGGQRYKVQRAASDNLGGGRVRPGDSRTGTLVFQIDASPDELNRPSLYFAYFPYRSVKSVRVPFSI